MTSKKKKKKKSESEAASDHSSLCRPLQELHACPFNISRLVSRSEASTRMSDENLSITSVTSQHQSAATRSQEKTNNRHTSVTISLNINASSRQKLLLGAHPAYSRGCAAQGRSSISGLRYLGQPGDEAPSAGCAALASPGNELHQRAPLPRPAWGMSSISGLGLSARRGVTYLRRRGGEWLRTDESSTGERRWSEVGAAR